jgi:hypothetical protein
MSDLQGLRYSEREQRVVNSIMSAYDEYLTITPIELLEEEKVDESCDRDNRC